MNAELENDLKRLHHKLDLLYREAQKMFMRHADYEPAKLIMPHFDHLCHCVKQVAHPAEEEKPEQEA